MSVTHFLLLALAGFAAGAVNALAGGGTLISFPLLMSIGLPPLLANVTNTIALCPGYLGAALAQRGDLRGQRPRLYLLLPIAMAGGLFGAWLLLHTNARAFGGAVPWLILLACALLAAQDRVRAALSARALVSDAGARRPGAAPLWLLPLVAVAAVYGGYFGAGVSVVVLAALGLLYADSLPRLNALKQTVALATNTAAATLLACSAPVDWRLVALLAAGALIGGACGGRLGRRMSPVLLRRAVVLLGVAVAVIYLLRSR